jgi:predicted glycogen debranching enzyme
MTPASGDRCQRFVGDRIRFTIRDGDGRNPLKGWQARLRTNLGRAEAWREEVLQAHTQGLPPAGASWRDLPMTQNDQGWSLELPLAEVGYFKAKAYLVDSQGWQHWPSGPDVGISVHPDRYRTSNIIYCAFPRLFGQTRMLERTRDEKAERALAPLDRQGYTVIPPSGKLRDLTKQLPHIFNTLGCRILHLLPMNPTPTTYARFGQFGSPYAALDLTAIDPALVVFDRQTTGVGQFRELTYEVHARGGRVFLDIVINHTGWGSMLQEEHPEWFLRQPDGAFVSPGAWGTTWEDLVELKYPNVSLVDTLADMLLTWCRRGVDGFRCDAGYKVPVASWQYIVARVQQEYPETVFLLEGLGGPWDATAALLTEGGMQWAYSELFQEGTDSAKRKDWGMQVAGYLDHSLKKSGHLGLLVHYSETHDNQRLAARGRAWSLLRNRLCALTSLSGGFGFTCGVEWLATEQIRVHGSTGLAWDNNDNLLPELGQLNRLLVDHPAFFDGTKLTRLSPTASPVYALLRESEEGKDRALVLVNTDDEHSHALTLDSLGSPKSEVAALKPLEDWVDLLGQKAPQPKTNAEGKAIFTLPPSAAYCLSPTAKPLGLHGDEYRRARAQAAWGLAALEHLFPVEHIGEFNWRVIADEVDRSPTQFLAGISARARESRVGEVASSPPIQKGDLSTSAVSGSPASGFPCVVVWTPLDLRRITSVPPGHWLLIHDTTPFRAALVCSENGSKAQNVESFAVRDGHVASFPPRDTATDATLLLERYALQNQNAEAAIRFLASDPDFRSHVSRFNVSPTQAKSDQAPRRTDLVLLTNGRGGMARLCVDLGRVLSKYDCVLGANLHPSLPVDRHVLVKRLRVWVNADGFISPLDFQSLAGFEAGPPAIWRFVANAGDGRTVDIELAAAMLTGRNTTIFRFRRPTSGQATGHQLPENADVRLTVRFDLEDRNFHCETKRNGGAEHHFSAHTHVLGAQPSAHTGFAFTPASDRQLRVFADAGLYHSQPEWSENIPHPVEQSRGQVGAGDAFSPGWFELPLGRGAEVTLVVTADPADTQPEEIRAAIQRSESRGQRLTQHATRNTPHKTVRQSFGEQLLCAARAFVVQRGTGKTVIAGYPWFLDWGRDTFICARGLVAAGLVEEVKQILLTFARFEKDGTLPNTIFGEDASNRDTSDAPLWFGVVAEELGSLVGPISSLAPTLESIARNYIRGTPNGIRMDPASALIWSPSHFTWMDTNYPAGTPREGYPVEIQALWIRLLRQLARLRPGGESQRWEKLAQQALDSLAKFFWRDERGYYADVLLAKPGQSAAQAVVDDALRSNALFVVSLGLVTGERARRCVEAVRRYLVVPGGLRSLAPLPVTVPLPIYAPNGHLLNNPKEPYWGRYEGDEDTRRKPAYHNGTAWAWTFPSFCEAMARAWDFAPEAVATARAYLGSLDRLMTGGCLGQLPEILDGDAPHTPRGCDAQAWSATEALRVWKLLGGKGAVSQ